MSDVRAAAVHCEARKLSYRQSKEGLVVSFVVHPDEMPAPLAIAPLGQRYMLALVAIGDDEQPIQPEAEKPSAALPAPTAEAVKAITIAGIWPSNLAFRRWCMGYAPNDMQAPDCGEDTATEWLRTEMGVKSRKEIAHKPEALAKFNLIRRDYDTACGRWPI